jgi:uncharacterized protein
MLAGMLVRGKKASLIASLLASVLAACASRQAAPEAAAAPATTPEPTSSRPPATAAPNTAATAAAPAAEPGPSGAINAFFQALSASDFAHAWAMFDAEVQRALSAEQLAQVWKEQTGALGTLKSVAPDAGVQRGGKQVHSVDLTFTGGRLVATVALDLPGHALAGLFFRPARTEASTAPYANPAQFRAQEVSVGKAPFILPGTLTLPVGAGPFPGVVLVHGSGPMDRDETVLANRPFKDLAEGLASRGVAVLRYDKRTFAHGPRLGRDITVDAEVVLDATYALEALRAHAGVDPQKLFVVGHSLGALLAPEIAERSQPVAGVVLLAPPARPPWDAIVDQMRYLGVPAELLIATEKSAAEVKQGTPGAELLGVPVAYWKDLAARDGVGAARRLKLPLLILRGERDYQVTEADIAIWRKGLGKRDNVVIETLPADNHLFVPGSGKPGPAEYATPGHVDEAVVTRLATFIRSPARRL